MPELTIGSPYVLTSTRNGTMLVNRNDFYMGVSFLKYGECAQHEIDVLLPLLQLPGAVIEVGANMGVHTVPMATELARQGRHMLAFEPQPIIFQQLCANLALNGLMNVTTFNYACGSENGIVNFEYPDYHSLGNFGCVDMFADRAGTASKAALCCTLDSIIEQDHVGLIKIDVEGFELRVLQGAARILARSHPVLYVENDRIPRSAALIQWLFEQDYRLWWHIPSMFNPDNFNGNRDNIYNNLLSCNMLCFHRSTNVSLPNFREITDADFHPFAQKLVLQEVG